MQAYLNNVFHFEHCCKFTWDKFYLNKYASGGILLATIACRVVTIPNSLKKSRPPSPLSSRHLHRIEISLVRCDNVYSFMYCIDSAGFVERGQVYKVLILPWQSSWEYPLGKAYELKFRVAVSVLTISVPSVAQGVDKMVLLHNLINLP